MHWVIARLKDGTEKQTLGRLMIFDELKKPYSCATLELPDRDNKFRVSRIPQGTYTVVKRWSKKYGYHFHVLDVEGRTMILIHKGNYIYQTWGCILVGVNFDNDINKDGLKDVTSSVYTMNQLLDRSPDRFKLTILDLDK